MMRTLARLILNPQNTYHFAQEQDISMSAGQRRRFLKDLCTWRNAVISLNNWIFMSVLSLCCLTMTNVAVSYMDRRAHTGSNLMVWSIAPLLTSGHRPQP